MSNPATGIHRAVFGAVSEDDVDDWLDRHVRRRLTAGVQEVVFRTGRLAAVYGLRLTGGDRVVAKVHRDGVNLGRLSAAVACPRILADAGYPCPRSLWVMAYNARCQVAMPALGHAPGDGSYLWRLSRERDGYRQLLQDPRG